MRPLPELLWLRPPKDDSVTVTLRRPPSTSPNGSNPLMSVSDLMTYWSVQQDRVGAHESARYALSAFVAAGSLVALAGIGDGQMTALGRWAVAVSVVAANVVALRFILGELRWIKIHQARAAAVLRTLSKELVEMQGLANQQWSARRASGENSLRFTSTASLQFLHWLIVIAAVVMAIFVPGAGGHA